MSAAVATILFTPEGKEVLGIVGKTHTVIRIRIRRSVIRIRVDETAIRIRIVIRTTDAATSEDFRLYFLLSSSLFQFFLFCSSSSPALLLLVRWRFYAIAIIPPRVLAFLRHRFLYRRLGYCVIC